MPLPGAAKTFTTALRARATPPLVVGDTTVPPQFGGAAKGKRLNGQARRLTSPHLEVLCRTSTGDYKAPLCCERLMKGMLRGALFCPLHRGKSGAARIGGGERSEPITRMPIKPYDTESKSRNVLASPLGEEGHEVAKGWTRGRMIMILDVDVTAERRHYNTHRP